MTNLSQLTGTIIEIELSSKKSITGKLIESGTDILVIYDGKQYYYIPFTHIQFIKQSQSVSTETNYQKSNQAPINKDIKTISFGQILNNAKGLFVDIYITGHQSLYGYITNILNDYLVLYSPVYKNMLIPLSHLKWLIPYHMSQTPYSLDKPIISKTMENEMFADTFEDQLKKHIGSLVIFDLGEDAKKIGKLQDLILPIVELITGSGETLYWNLNHLKSVQIVAKDIK
ncbi:hypothetical protein [Jeotgalibacillus soli]|uniref:DUF2642 domain-containing protein n=1 Tax=Jeotgalibacillus soli TaxID=889306 RepID=A0A0C2R8V6_9BACL|nr:hypothetical protein [Jeotgalibacillus soli]KIL46730.1 hypothetical protein KP78_18480 [Jeotgalibacillus soli]